METVTGVILKTQDYTDNQKIVSVFSKERGYMTFMAPSFVFKRNNSRTAVCMQIAEIELYENTRGGLHKLKTMIPVVHNAAVYLDVYKMNIALLWSEVLNLLLKKEPKNDALFDFIRYSVEYLNTTEWRLLDQSSISFFIPFGCIDGVSYQYGNICRRGIV